MQWLLRKEELFNHLGITLVDDKGQFKQTYEALRELAEVWKDLDEIQQEYCAQSLFKMF